MDKSDWDSCSRNIENRKDTKKKISTSRYIKSRPNTLAGSEFGHNLFVNKYAAFSMHPQCSRLLSITAQEISPHFVFRRLNKSIRTKSTLKTLIITVETVYINGTVKIFDLMARPNRFVQHQNIQEAAIHRKGLHNTRQEQQRRKTIVTNCTRSMLQNSHTISICVHCDDDHP